MSQFSGSEITSDDKLWAALSYLPLIWPVVAIIVLLMEDKRSRPYIKFHAVQALVLGVIAYITLAFCVGILLFLYMFFLGYKAYQGEDSPVPFVSDFIRNQGWA